VWECSGADFEPDGGYFRITKIYPGRKLERFLAFAADGTGIESESGATT